MTNLKQCDTATRVFKMLLFLFKNPASVDEIVQYFKETDENNKIYSYELFLKYINTLKAAGINIVKINEKYTVLNCSHCTTLSKTELEGLKLIIKTYLPETATGEFINEFLYDLEKILSDETRNKLESIKNISPDKKSDNSEKKELIKELENHKRDNTVLKIRLKDGFEYTGKPSDIHLKNNKTFCTIDLYKKGTKYDIDISEIEHFYALPTHDNSNLENQTIILFKLTGNLAKRYTLKEGEYLHEYNKDYIIVANKEEPENLLLKRLLRYENLCEVLLPLNVRFKMKTLTENMLKMYED